MRYLTKQGMADLKVRWERATAQARAEGRDPNQDQLLVDMGMLIHEVESAFSHIHLSAGPVDVEALGSVLARIDNAAHVEVILVGLLADLRGQVWERDRAMRADASTVAAALVEVAGER